MLFKRSLLFFTIFLISGSLFVRGYYRMPYPKPLGKTFKPAVSKFFADELAAKQPEIVLLGDSVLYEGVDNAALSKYLDTATYNLGVPGSGSAVWYLLLKNIVVEAPVKPKYTVVLFRDTMLTIPTFRTQGNYFAMLDEYANRHEPFLNQVAYINPMNPLDKVMEQYLPLYGARWDLRSGLDSGLRYPVPQEILQCNPKCVDRSMDEAFGAQTMDAVVLQQSIYDADVLYAPENLDFEKNIANSFLPRMIYIAREKGVTLIFVRMKSMALPDESFEPPALKNYIVALKEYFSNEQVQLIDLAHDERIEESFFNDMVHLNEEGKRVFTRILADEIRMFVK